MFEELPDMCERVRDLERQHADQDPVVVSKDGRPRVSHAARSDSLLLTGDD